MRWLRLLAVLGIAFLGLLAPARAANTKARLLLPLQAAKPGDTFLAGVELAMAPGWHTYWRNGGDSGAATTIDWQLPPGLSAGPIQWPAPERLSEADLITFVHHGTITLLVPISIAADTRPGPVDLSATVKWLECKESCIPARGTIQGRLSIGNESSPSPDAPALAAAQSRLPKAIAPGEAQASWDAPATGEERPLVIRWTSAGANGEPEFYPDASDAFEVKTPTIRLPPIDGQHVLRKVVHKIEGAWPTEVRGVLALVDKRGAPVSAVETVLPIRDIDLGAPSTAGGPTPPPAPATPGSPSAPTTAASAVAAPLSIGRALLLGLLGGIILNIMPCVLPVIALKILGFVRQAGSRPAEIRKLGLVYGLGVWFSFLVLAGAVIAVKGAAGSASWGMQFGNPVFLVVMTALVLLVALSLFGVYEINVGGKALDAAGDLASKEGPAGAFFNGMLAVALATPCTAPFLAPALGYAFAADAVTIVLVFTAIAFGLAAPYVLLSWQPAWLRFLPKPGLWMEQFKQAMGFPMLATALWLYTLAADHFGSAGPLWLGLFLVGLAMAAWVWGAFVQRARRGQTAGMIAAFLIVAAFYVYALEKELHWRNPPQPPSSPSAQSPNRPDGIAWQPWSKEAVASARAAGKPVFVDFTAKWCLTCDLNERSSIEIPAVREKLRAIGAVTLKGDHTRLPQVITEELQRFGRAGVPLVLVYPRDASQAPQVLPAFLTPTLVLDALSRAAL